MSENQCALTASYHTGRTVSKTEHFPQHQNYN